MIKSLYVNVSYNPPPHSLFFLRFRQIFKKHMKINTNKKQQIIIRINTKDQFIIFCFDISKTKRKLIFIKTKPSYQYILIGH
jgi:hypothetical protein